MLSIVLIHNKSGKTCIHLLKENIIVVFVSIKWSKKTIERAKVLNH